MGIFDNIRSDKNTNSQSSTGISFEDIKKNFEKPDELMTLLQEYADTRREQMVSKLCKQFGINRLTARVYLTSCEIRLLRGDKEANKFLKECGFKFNKL